MTPQLAALSPAVGWALAVAAVTAGYMGYGWPGVFLALSVVVFWLLLQFSRAVRAMRNASGRPVGRVDNAVMLHAKLRTGMHLMDILKLTRSLGTVVTHEPAGPPEGRMPKGEARRLPNDPEVFVWEDDAGDRVEVELQAGRVTRWALQRAQTGAAADVAGA